MCYESIPVNLCLLSDNLPEQSNAKLINLIIHNDLLVSLYCV